MDEEDVIHSHNIFFCNCIVSVFLIFSRSGFWSPFLLFLTKLLRFLNHTIASIHYLFRLSCTRVVSKAQIHEDV